MINNLFQKKDYNSLVERLFSTSFFGGMKLDLQNSLRLSEALGSPQNAFKSILIAGTNGKGSVSQKIAKALELSGFKTGLYTSPHISCFRERIKINSALISEEDVEELLSEIFVVAEKQSIPATFFELITALAFCCFKKHQVDFAVLEVGLGGRLDATNIVQPVLSVITSIHYDHTAHLGETLQSIAKEKGGIIKPFVPVVLGPTAAAHQVLMQIAEEKEAPCIEVNHPPIGFYDNENTSIARAALQELSKRYHLKEEAIEKGLVGRPACRFQILSGMNSPPWVGKFPEAVILDVAHNPNGLERLFEAAAIHYPNRLIRVLAGLSKDKDLKNCLEIIGNMAVQIHFVQAPHARAASAGDLQKILLERGLYHATAHSTIEEGVKKAIGEAAEHGEILIICGSFFIMSQVRKTLGIAEPRDPYELNENYSGKTLL